MITGASTGIGNAAAVRLAAAGFDVHAGVRNAADAERLRSAGLRPLTIDVTDEASIAEEVAEPIVHALTAKKPRTRYLVGRDAKIQARIARIVPDRVFDALVARELR